MEKFVKPCDKESMRLAMLKHEETFREQVCELHRLYQVQKFMMRNIQSSKHNEQHQERLNFCRGGSFIQTCNDDITKHNKQERRFLLDQPAQEAIPNFCGARFAEETIDETEIELTLGPSSYVKRKKTEKPERTSLTSESRQSISSTEFSHINRIIYLQTQQLNGSSKEEVGLVQVPDLKSGGQSKSKSIEIEERLRQERLKQPPCIFQVLSLNMT